MHCTCSCSPLRSDSQFLKAVKKGLDDFQELPGAFSIARNGGCEQTFRNLLLDPLEKELHCAAFTEVAGVDIVLVCPDCKNTWANIEVKSNFSTQPEVQGRRDEATAQLKKYECETNPCHSFCLQLVTHLTAPDQRSPLAKLRSFNNDKNHVTQYKCFPLPKRDEDADQYDKVIGRLGIHPLFKLDKITAISCVGQPEAAVWCWVWRLDDGGELVSVSK